MISPEKQEELRKLLEEKLSIDNCQKLIEEHNLDPRTDEYDQFMINYMIGLVLSVLKDDNYEFIKSCDEFFEEIFDIKPKAGLSAELIIWCMVKELYPTLTDSIKHDIRVYGDKPEEGYDQLDVVIQDDDNKIDKLYTVKDTDVHKKEARELQALATQLESDDKLTEEFSTHMIGTKAIVSTAVPLAERSFTSFPINIDTLKIEPYKLEFKIYYNALKPFYDIKVEMTADEQKYLEEIASKTGSKNGDTITLDSPLILEPNENIMKLLNNCGAMNSIEKIAKAETENILDKLCKEAIQKTIKSGTPRGMICDDEIKERVYSMEYDKIYQTKRQQRLEYYIEKNVTLEMYVDKFIAPTLTQQEGIYEVCMPMYRMYKEHKISTSKIILEFHSNDIHIEHTMIINTEARQAVWKDKDSKTIQHLNKELFLKYKDEIEKKIKKS